MSIQEIFSERGTVIAAEFFNSETLWTTDKGNISLFG